MKLYFTTFFLKTSFKCVVLLTTEAPTRTLVELAGLRDVPFAQFGPLSNRWSFAVDVIAGQDCVQEDASEIGQTGDRDTC